MQKSLLRSVGIFLVTVPLAWADSPTTRPATLPSAENAEKLRTHAAELSLDFIQSKEIQFKATLNEPVTRAVLADYLKSNGVSDKFDDVLKEINAVVDQKYVDQIFQTYLIHSVMGESNGLTTGISRISEDAEGREAMEFLKARGKDVSKDDPLKVTLKGKITDPSVQNGEVLGGYVHLGSQTTNRQVIVYVKTSIGSVPVILQTENLRQLAGGFVKNIFGHDQIIFVNPSDQSPQALTSTLVHELTHMADNDQNPQWSSSVFVDYERDHLVMRHLLNDATYEKEFNQIKDSAEGKLAFQTFARWMRDQKPSLSLEESEALALKFWRRDYNQSIDELIYYRTAQFEKSGHWQQIQYLKNQKKLNLAQIYEVLNDQKVGVQFMNGQSEMIAFPPAPAVVRYFQELYDTNELVPDPYVQIYDTYFATGMDELTCKKFSNPISEVLKTPEDLKAFKLRMAAIDWKSLDDEARFDRALEILKSYL